MYKIIKGKSISGEIEYQVSDGSVGERAVSYDFKALEDAQEIVIKLNIEEEHGQVWNTKELQKDFTVLGFASPCVVVIRKSDGVKGTLEFIHQPRFYFGFVAG